MLKRAKRIIALGIMVLVIAVISRPVFSYAVTAPSVTVLSPIAQGLRTPVKIALDAEGNLYVADPRAGGIVKLNMYGVKQGLIPTVNAANGLCFAQDGTLLVSQGNAVVRYNAATGQEIGRLNGGNLRAPAGIAIDDVTGYIYVVDSPANQVVVFTASGDFVKTFGTTGTISTGMLKGPSGISFEKVARQFAVADTNNNRIQFFDVNGVFVKSIGTTIADATGTSTSLTSVPTVGAMQFEAPAAIVFEYSRNQTPAVLYRTYVVDAFQGNIKVLDPATSTVPLVNPQTTTIIGSIGTANGQLTKPSGAVFDTINSRLMVVNGFGNITNYGIDGGTNPVDRTPPQLSIDPVIATVSVPGVTISGTVESGAVVNVVAGGSAVAGPVQYLSSTIWKCEVTGLAAGNNVISVSAKDAQENATAPQSVNVVYLLPAPALNVANSVPSLTNQAAIDLNGTVESGVATVVVTNATASVSGTATVTGTNWFYRVDLVEGANNIVIVAQKAQSADAVVSQAITLDTVPPALAVSALSDGSYTSNQVQNITGTASDIGNVAVLVNGVPVTMKDGVFSAPLTLVDGANSVVVEVRDLAGNVTFDKRSLIYDSSAPQISITEPMDNSYTNNASIQISGTTSETAMVVISGVPVVVDNNKWSYTLNLAAGLNTVEVVATDLAGNTSTLKRSVIYDAASPVLAITSPVQDMALNQSGLMITCSVADENAATLAYAANGKTTPLAADTTGACAFKVDFVDEGVYPIVITATDSAGNTTSVTRSLIFDITPPLLTLDSVKWQAQALGGRIGGTVEPGAEVTIKEDGKPVSAAKVVTVSGNKWNADLSGSVYNQTKLSVTATDAAGNSTTMYLKADANNSKTNK